MDNPKNLPVRKDIDDLARTSPIVASCMNAFNYNKLTYVEALIAMVKAYEAQNAELKTQLLKATIERPFGYGS
jgi:hypothetical protein